MGTLNIERNSEWNNKARSFGIYIQGEKIGTLKDGESFNYEIQAGTHEIQAKIDWCTSQTLNISIEENESKTVKLTGYKYGSLIIRIGLFIMLIHFLLILFFDLDLNILIYIATPALLLPIYYLTFGKGKYLNLSEEV